jgi:hypothetical protein
MEDKNMTNQTHHLKLPILSPFVFFVYFVVKKQNEPNFPRFQPKNKDFQKNEPNSNPKWAKHPASLSFTPARRDVLILAPGFRLLASSKKQNEPNFPFFNRKSNLENLSPRDRKSQNEPI